MKSLTYGRRIAGALGVLVVFAVAGAVWADEHVRFPGDVPVDIYYSRGTIGFLHDDEWVVIPFWRLPESIPLDFNLLDTFDPRAVDLPLLVEGHARFRDNLPMSWSRAFLVRGLDGVPRGDSQRRVDYLRAGLVGFAAQGHGQLLPRTESHLRSPPGEPLHHGGARNARRRSLVQAALRRGGPGARAGADRLQVSASKEENPGRWGVAIPKTGNARFLLFCGSGAYDLVDDFVQPNGRFIANVAAVREKFVYSTQEGVKVVERTEERIREFTTEAPIARTKSNDEHGFGHG